MANRYRYRHALSSQHYVREEKLFAIATSACSPRSILWAGHAARLARGRQLLDTGSPALTFRTTLLSAPHCSRPPSTASWPHCGSANARYQLLLSA